MSPPTDAPCPGPALPADMAEKIARAIEPAAWFKRDRHGAASAAYDGTARLLVERSLEHAAAVLMLFEGALAARRTQMGDPEQGGCS